MEKEENTKETIKNSVEGYPKLELQIDEKGGVGKGSFDLTVSKISKISEKGKMDFSDNERKIAKTEKIKPIKENKDDKYGWWNLSAGVYIIEINEKISLPKNKAGKIYSRASLLKNGSFVVPCFLEKGYNSEDKDSGKSFTLIVQNTEGIDIKENARILGLIFE